LRRESGCGDGEELSQVVEHDHAVAQKAPSLLGVGSHGVRELTRRVLG
jgi:hypothetical protein